MNAGEKGRFSFGGRWSAANKFLIQGTSMLSSRKAMTNAGFPDTDGQFAVDVGEGKTATLVEEFIARLEPHGIRRSLLSESEDDEYEAYMAHRKLDGLSGTRCPSVSPSEQGGEGEGDAKGNTVVEEREEDQRAPYYYSCKCCDCRLTPISTSSASMEALQDIHYHCSLASHRKRLSWMIQPDQTFSFSVEGGRDYSGILEEDEYLMMNDMDMYMKETLRNQPEWLHPEEYLRIYVNGMPVLISRRPGGGEMFFPLPHEVEEQKCFLKDAPQHLDDDRNEGVMWPEEVSPLWHALEREQQVDDGREEECGVLKPLYPPCFPQKSFWYYPMQTFSCHAHQHVFLLPDGLEPRGGMKRNTRALALCREECISMEDIPWKTYQAFSPIEKYLSSTEPNKSRSRRSEERSVDLAEEFVEGSSHNTGRVETSHTPSRRASSLPSRMIVCFGRLRRNIHRKRARSVEPCRHAMELLGEEDPTLSVEGEGMERQKEGKGSSEGCVSSTSLSLACTPSSPFASTFITPESCFLLSEDVEEYPDLKKKGHARRNHDICRYPVLDGDCFEVVYMNRKDYPMFAKEETAVDATTLSASGTQGAVEVPTLTLSLLRQVFPSTKKETKRQKLHSSASSGSAIPYSDDSYFPRSPASYSASSRNASSPPAMGQVPSGSVPSLSPSSSSSSSFLSSFQPIRRRR